MLAPEKIGNIRIVDVIARGGMGDVYAGFDEKLERQVALKALRHDRAGDPINKAWFLREARILSQLDHPDICRIYDYVEGDGRDFLVLELIEGKTLRKAIQEGLDERFRMKIATDVAAVLAATHAAGLIHRDLKPDNLMITPEGQIKVLDFGVARAADSSAAAHRTPEAPAEPGSSAPDPDVQTTRAEVNGDAQGPLETAPGRIPGTPQFMSPEQARMDPLTAASDMYSLGLVLQELFTEKLPYERGLTEFQLLIKAAEAQTLPVEGLDAELTTLIERLKSTDPAARPTAVDTLERLERLRDRPRRGRRRILTAAALVVLAFLAAVMTFQTVRISQIARRAEEQADLARSRQLTAEASALLDGHLDRSLLLALEAERFSPTPEARDVLLAALERSPWLSTILTTGSNQIYEVAWSPDGDLVAAGTDYSVSIWNARTGELATELTGHEGRVWGVAWSGDGELFASASTDHTLRLWDARTGRLRHSPLVGHEAEVWMLAWSPDGARVASSGQDHQIRLWDAATGKQIGQPIAVRANAWSVAWSGDGSTLAFSDGDTVRLWDVAARRDLGGPVTVPDGPIWSVAWSGDDQRLALGSDRRIWLWDVASRRFDEPLEGHESAVHSVAWNPVAWNPAHQLLASCGADKTVRLWDTVTGKGVAQPLRGHADSVMNVAWSPDGRRLVSGGFGGNVLLWDVDSDEIRGQTFLGHGNWVVKVAWSPDGRTLASSGVDQKIRLWDVVTGQALGPPFGDYDGGVWSLAWSPDGQVLASGDEEWMVRLWDRQGRSLGPPLQGHEGEIVDLAWSPDSAILVSAGQDATLRFWDVASAREVKKIAIGTKDTAANSVSWTRDGRTLYSGGIDGRIRSWDAATGHPVGDPIAAHPESIRGLALSPDGATLATGSRDATVRLWDVATRQALGEPLAGHLDEVREVAWSADGQLLASASKDGTIRLWDVALGHLASVHSVGRLRSHRSGVLSVAWHPTKRFLASGSVDQTVVLRDLSGSVEDWRRRACRRARRNLTEAEWSQLVGPEVPYHVTCPSLLEETQP